MFAFSYLLGVILINANRRKLFRVLFFDFYF